MTASGTSSSNVTVKMTESHSEYVILARDDAGHWNQHSNVTGRSADHAVRKHAEKNGNKPGTFVAIPRKSWKPLTVKAETVTTLKLEEVKA